MALNNPNICAECTMSFEKESLQPDPRNLDKKEGINDGQVIYFDG